MRLHVLAAMTLAFAGPALAESPTPAVPEKMPFATPYGAPITLAPAQKLVAAATAEATRRGWAMNVAVVDAGGHLVAFARMDGAQLASVAIAQRKARIAVGFRRETRVFYEAMEKGHANIGTLDPEMVASPGGIPLLADGRIVGAIGCSGGTGDQDAVVCQAAIRAATTAGK